MRPLTAVALFCEDIRQEKAGTDSIVGIMPDNAEVGKIPGTFPKIAIYIRIQMDPTADPGPISLELRMPNGEIQPGGAFAPEVVAKSLADTREQKSPIASLILRSIVVNLTVKAPGRILAVLKHGKEETLCGFLNILGPPNPAPTA